MKMRFPMTLVGLLFGCQSSESQGRELQGTATEFLNQAIRLNQAIHPNQDHTTFTVNCHTHVMTGAAVPCVARTNLGRTISLLCSGDQIGVRGTCIFTGSYQ